MPDGRDTPDEPIRDTPSSLRRCPICGKPATAENHPFCSARCKDVDLHRWLGGTYALPAEETDDPDQDDQH